MSLKKPNRFRITSIIIALVVVILMLTIMFSPFMSTDNLAPSSPNSKIDGNTTTSSAIWPTHEYSNFVTVWQRKNTSTPGLPLPYADLPPSYGMEFFRTNVLNIEQYSEPEINDLSLFPADCNLIIILTGFMPTSYYVNAAINVSNQAKNDPRIIGALWDDFPVGEQSASNMTAIYRNIHHEDANLTQGPLKLFIVVYEENWYLDTPNSWASIDHYYDGVEFWLLAGGDEQHVWEHLVDYEMSIKEFRAGNQSKVIKGGIYLHMYFDARGIQPYDFTADELKIYGRLIKEGILQGISVLQPQCININPDTAYMIRNYIVNEMAPTWASTWNWTSDVVTTTRTGVTASPAISDIVTKWAGNKTFISHHNQNVTVTEFPGTALRVQIVRTGEFVTSHTLGSAFYFVAVPNEMYQICNWFTISVSYSSNQYIITPTKWENKEVTMNGAIYVNSSFWVNNTIIRFNTRHAWSIDAFGFTFNASNSSKFYMNNSTIEPVNRHWAYFFNTSRSYAAGITKVMSIHNSTIACYSYPFENSGLGYFELYDSVIFNPLFAGGTVKDLDLVGATNLEVARSMIWSYGSANMRLAWVMPIELNSTGGFVWNNVSLFGGILGLGTDVTWDTHGTTFDTMLIDRTDVAEQAYSDTYGGYDFITAVNGGTGIHWYNFGFSLKTDLPISGTLKNANGGTIGSYSSSNGFINANILWGYYNLASVIIVRNPFPWTFTITSSLPSGYYYALADTSVFNQNRSSWEYPVYRELNSTTFTIQQGEIKSLRLVQMEQQLWTGVTNYISASNTLTWADTIHYWSTSNWTTPNQVGLVATVNTGILEVRRISYSPASSIVASWNADGTTGEVATFTLSGLESGVGYKVYVDGVLYYQQLKGLTDLTFTYSGPWSEHEFQVIAWDMGKPDVTLDASFSYTINGNLVTFTDKSYGPVVNWIWNFGDGTGSTKQSPTHTYKASGKYIVSLTVYDSDGHSSKASVEITLALGPNFPIERNPSGWDIYISDQLTVSMSAVGLLVGGAIMFVSAIFLPSVPFITPKGRKLIGALMVLAGLYFLIFVDNSWMKF